MYVRSPYICLIMALKIAFTNQKGGCGKSTSTLLCANAFSSDPFNHNVAVLDMDRQKSLLTARSYEDRDKYIYPIIQADNLDDIGKYNNDYDLLFIDVAGRIDDKLHTLLNNIDLLFIPFTPGTFSLDSTLSFIEYVTNYRKEKNAIFEVYAFINMYSETLRNHQFLKLEYDKAAEQYDMKFMRTRLKRSTLFEDLETHGSFYDENSSNKAKLNCTIWLNEIYKNMTE